MPGFCLASIQRGAHTGWGVSHSLCPNNSLRLAGGDSDETQGEKWMITERGVVRMHWWNQENWSTLTFCNLNKATEPQKESFILRDYRYVEQIKNTHVCGRHESGGKEGSSKLCNRCKVMGKGGQMEVTEDHPLPYRHRWKRWVERLTAAICASSTPPLHWHDMKIIAEDILSMSLVN